MERNQAAFIIKCLSKSESYNYVPARMLQTFINELADQAFEDLPIHKLMTLPCDSVGALIDERFKGLGATDPHFIAMVIEHFGGVSRMKSTSLLEWYFKLQEKTGVLNSHAWTEILRSGSMKLVRKFYFKLPIHPEDTFLERVLTTTSSKDPDFIYALGRYMVEERNIPILPEYIAEYLARKRNSVYGKLIDYLVCVKGCPIKRTSTFWARDLSECHAWKTLLYFTKRRFTQRRLNDQIQVTYVPRDDENYGTIYQLMKVYPRHYIVPDDGLWNQILVHSSASNDAVHQMFRQALITSIRQKSELLTQGLYPFYYQACKVGDWRICHECIRQTTGGVRKSSQHNQRPEDDPPFEFIYRFLEAMAVCPQVFCPTFFGELLDLYASRDKFKFNQQHFTTPSLASIIDRSARHITKAQLSELVEMSVKAPKGFMDVTVLEQVYVVLSGHKPNMEFILQHGTTDSLQWYLTKEYEESASRQSTTVVQCIITDNLEMTRTYWDFMNKHYDVQNIQLKWFISNKNYTQSLQGVLQFITQHIVTSKTNRPSAIKTLEFMLREHLPLQQYLREKHTCLEDRILNRAIYECYEYFQLCRLFNFTILFPKSKEYTPSHCIHVQALAKHKQNEMSELDEWLAFVFARACKTGQLALVKYLVTEHGYRVDDPSIQLHDNVLSYAIRVRWLVNHRTIWTKTKQTFTLPYL